MASMAQLRYSPLSHHHHHHYSHNRLLPNNSFPSSRDLTFHLSKPLSSQQIFHLSKPLSSQQTFHLSASTGGSGGGGFRSGGGGGGGDGDGRSDDSSSSSWDYFGPIGLFIKGWQSRVAADPQFPFKVLMEELVGVSACVLGDMASRPNFGLNELDFVFSTLVVGSIMNFVLMYLLAPTLSSSASTLPSIFASCPTSHMFEPGAYGFFDRFGTFVYKGVLFAAVGFAAGLVGTAISNGLITMRKKMDPNFETPNKPPPTLLNATTWALHMGLSSNFRYQTLNGIEFLLAKTVPGAAFKTSVVALRLVNNVLGGMSFVLLARLTGSQAVDAAKEGVAGDSLESTDKLKSLDHDKHDDHQNQTNTNLPNNQST